MIYQSFYRLCYVTQHKHIYFIFSTNFVSLLLHLDCKQPQESDNVKYFQIHSSARTMLSLWWKLCEHLLIYCYMSSLFFFLFTLHYLFLRISKSIGRVGSHCEKIFSRSYAVNFRTKWGMECSYAPRRMTLSVAQMAKCMETSVPCVQVCCEYLSSSVPPNLFIIHHVWASVSLEMCRIHTMGCVLGTLKSTWAREEVILSHTVTMWFSIQFSFYRLGKSWESLNLVLLCL